ncbi:hypothetical protein BJV82DRAFT_595399 [Fennellomyces sp. T-0311]|nr:hypothetical protein BJV82DRAFT_595399 [Fennellomyces sp. T-0311]
MSKDIHCEKENDMLSPPLTPKEDYDPCTPNRKGFIQAYAQMVPHLRPVDSRMYGKKRGASIDWLATHEKHHQIFTFDLCKLLAPVLREHKRKRQERDDDEEEQEESSSSDISLSSHKPSVARKKKKAEDRKPARRNTRDLSIKGFTIDPQYAFDTIDVDIDDHGFYPSEWYPSTDCLDEVPVDINWKGKPLKLDTSDPYFARLHPAEANVISHMRLSPQLYIRCKRAIIMAAREFSMHQLDFRKSDAQKVCRIDVNKSSRLWAAFNAYGWLKPST